MSNKDKQFNMWLSNSGIDCIRSVDLSTYSYFKTGGQADYILLPSNHLQLVECVRRLNTYEISL